MGHRDTIDLMSFRAKLVFSLEASVIEIERRVRAAHPEVMTLFVKPQTATLFKETVQRLIGATAIKNIMDCKVL